MKLSLIIPYTYSEDKNREEGLKSLMKSIASQTYKDFEIILVEDLQGRDSIYATFLPATDFEYNADKYILLQDPEHRKFNKAWLMNVGAKQATTDNLLFMDAEISFSQDFLQKVVDFAKDRQFFNCWSKYICMAGRDNPHERKHILNKTVHAMIGVFYSKKDFFFNKLGGYNENYFGYGAEDNDIFIRAKYLLKEISCLEYNIYHHYHHWHPKEGANPLNLDREIILQKTIDNPQEIINKLTTSNIGNIQCPTLI
jgi:predicted glycosyltransferase involved in capsule biosynthesis